MFITSVKKEKENARKSGEEEGEKSQWLFLNNAKKGMRMGRIFFGGGQKMKEMEIVGNEGTRRGIDRRRDWMGIRPGRMCTLHLDQPSTPHCQWSKRKTRVIRKSV